MNFELSYQTGETQKPSLKRLNYFKLSYHSLGAIVALSEAATILAASLFTQTFSMGMSSAQAHDLHAAANVGIAAAFIYVIFCRSSELYKIQNLLNPIGQAAKIAVIWSFSLLCLAGFVELLEADSGLSRSALLAFAGLGSVALLGTRLISSWVIQAMLRHGAIGGRRAIVLGTAEELGKLSPSSLLVQYGMKEVERFTLSNSAASNEDDLLLARALLVSRSARVEEFLIAADWNTGGLVSKVGTALQGTPLPVRILPCSLMRLQAGASAPSMLTIQRAPLNPVELGVKRVLDFIVALFAIVLLSPIFVITALAVKLDSPGPVIFKQRRNGFNQRQFLIFKFRTMRVLEDGAIVRQATRDDPRVTRVGRFLRSASVDELPQLFNVLKGDMSLVGPRPHALAHDDQYKRLIETYCGRHHVKPGITGWAQVNGSRGETKELEQMKTRVELDLWYITNWSIWLDLRILLKTAFSVLFHKAY